MRGSRKICLKGSKFDDFFNGRIHVPLKTGNYRSASKPPFIVVVLGISTILLSSPIFFSRRGSRPLTAPLLDPRKILTHQTASIGTFAISKFTLLVLSVNCAQVRLFHLIPPIVHVKVMVPQTRWVSIKRTHC